MTDAELIADLGGPSKVAALLSMKKNGAQRVHNWTKRGIPAAIKLQFPQIFLKRRKAAEPTQEGAA